jgi:hypothetical protein
VINKAASEILVLTHFLRRLKAIRSIVFARMVFHDFASFSEYIRARVTSFTPSIDKIYLLFDFSAIS